MSATTVREQGSKSESGRSLRSACDLCHQTKTKCSGRNPCHGCQRLGIDCVYSASNRMGRPKGTRNKKTLERVKTFQASKKANGEAGGNVNPNNQSSPTAEGDNEMARRTQGPPSSSLSSPYDTMVMQFLSGSEKAPMQEAAAAAAAAPASMASLCDASSKQLNSLDKFMGSADDFLPAAKDFDSHRDAVGLSDVLRLDIDERHRPASTYMVGLGPEDHCLQTPYTQDSLDSSTTSESPWFSSLGSIGSSHLNDITSPCYLDESPYTTPSTSNQLEHFEDDGLLHRRDHQYGPASLATRDVHQRLNSSSDHDAVKASSSPSSLGLTLPSSSWGTGTSCDCVQQQAMLLCHLKSINDQHHSPKIDLALLSAQRALSTWDECLQCQICSQDQEADAVHEALFLSTMSINSVLRMIQTHTTATIITTDDGGAASDAESNKTPQQQTQIQMQAQNSPHCGDQDGDRGLESTLGSYKIGSEEGRLVANMLLLRTLKRINEAIRRLRDRSEQAKRKATEIGTSTGTGEEDDGNCHGNTAAMSEKAVSAATSAAAEAAADSFAHVLNSIQRLERLSATLQRKASASLSAAMLP